MYLKLNVDQLWWKAFKLSNFGAKKLTEKCHLAKSRSNISINRINWSMLVCNGSCGPKYIKPGQSTLMDTFDFLYSIKDSLVNIPFYSSLSFTLRHWLLLFILYNLKFVSKWIYDSWFRSLAITIVLPYF